MLRPFLIFARASISPRKVLDAMNASHCKPEELLNPENPALLQALGEKKRAELLSLYDSLDEDRIIRDASSYGARLIHWADEDYPTLLRNIYDPPLVIFVSGEYDKNSRMAAVIGSRNADEYGRRMARNIAGGLAESGVTVISGLARGIDEEAHSAALAAGGKTLAVMGTGHDRIYPASNISLASRIVRSGALVSELFPKEKSRKDHFLRRNRIISGMSECVVIIQAGARSGTLSTAETALEQGRDVLAVPGRADDPMSEGTLRLIGEGASVVVSAQDVLFNMGMGSHGSRDRNTCLSPREHCVYNLIIKSGSAGFDELLTKSGLSVRELLASLGLLSHLGIVTEDAGGIYSACRSIVNKTEQDGKHQENRGFHN